MSTSDRTQESDEPHDSRLTTQRKAGSLTGQPSAESQLGDAYEKWIHPPLGKCWYLTGATCSGKTPLAIELAKRLDAEIISLDSMAVYRGMDIGTAKPTAEQRAQVPHHLIDIVDPTQPYSVSNFVTDAHHRAAQIRQRGRNVIVCGGTPLYLKSLIRGLFLGPEADWEFRGAVEDDVAKYGQEALLARLEQVDPLLAHKLHPHDHRRMIRALEVARITGKPLSHWQQQFDTPGRREDFPVAVMRIDRAWLHERINLRVEKMLGQGLVAEVQNLLQVHGRLGRTASQAVGYREVLQHLREGSSYDETLELIRAHTRQFARRQEIWFRGLEELEWFDVSPDKPMHVLADELASFYEQTPQPITKPAPDRS